MISDQTDTEAVYWEVVGEGCGCPVDTSVQSTEAPTEATAETSAPPEENEAITRRVILSLSNPKGAAGGISSAYKTNSAERKISL